MFGGRTGQQGRTNDVYIIDLSTMVCIVSVPHSHMYSLQRITLQSWSKLNRSGGGPCLEERAGHAACCLNYGQQFPQLLVIGGVDRQGRPLGGVWVLDIERGKWRKVRDFGVNQVCLVV